MKSQSKFPDSNETYDAFAPYYREYAKKKAKYLAAIDELILENLPTRTDSILDIGCGDGVRLAGLLQRISHKEVWAIDSSTEMLSLAEKNVDAKILQADIGNSSIDKDLIRRFDVILCLWNVLGHVGGQETRGHAILNMSKALKENGRIYIDTNNRHNVSHYGIRTVLKNLMTDFVRPGRDNGTLPYEIRVTENKAIDAYSHFFNPGELLPLFSTSGLHPLKTRYVDYATGAIAGPWSGNIFYVLEKSEKKNAR